MCNHSSTITVLHYFFVLYLNGINFIVCVHFIIQNCVCYWVNFWIIVSLKFSVLMCCYIVAAAAATTPATTSSSKQPGLVHPRTYSNIGGTTPAGSLLSPAFNQYPQSPVYRSPEYHLTQRHAGQAPAAGTYTPVTSHAQPASSVPRFRVPLHRLLTDRLANKVCEASFICWFLVINKYTYFCCISLASKAVLSPIVGDAIKPFWEIILRSCSVMYVPVNNCHTRLRSEPCRVNLASWCALLLPIGHTCNAMLFLFYWFLLMSYC